MKKIEEDNEKVKREQEEEKRKAKEKIEQVSSQWNDYLIV